MRRPPATFSTDAFSWSRARVRPPPVSTAPEPGLSSSSGRVRSRSLRRRSSISLTRPTMPQAIGPPRGVGHIIGSPMNGVFGDRVEFMTLLSAEGRRRLEAGASRENCRAGALAHHAGDQARAFVVERGLMRVFWSDPNGRQATVAYSGTGELIGATSIMGHVWVGASVQAVVDTKLRHLDLAAARNVATIELEFAPARGRH